MVSDGEASLGAPLAAALSNSPSRVFASWRECGGEVVPRNSISRMSFHGCISDFMTGRVADDGGRIGTERLARPPVSRLTKRVQICEPVSIEERPDHVRARGGERVLGK